MTCGPNILELEGPWVEDTEIQFVQTPLSKVHQGEYSIETLLPDYRMIYTDSGSDTDFKIKYIEYGWGTFIQFPDEPNYLLQIEKYCELWSEYNSKCIFFQKIETVSTNLSKNFNLEGDSSPSASIEPPTPPSAPDEVDISIFCEKMILDYLPWCNPPINYIEGQPAYATYYEVGIAKLHYDLISGWAGWYGTGGYSYLIKMAPDKYGFYMIFYHDVWDWDILDYRKLIGYVFFMHSIIYGTEEVIDILREAYIASDGEL